jgi:hypothetical protein
MNVLYENNGIKYCVVSASYLAINMNVIFPPDIQRAKIDEHVDEIYDYQMKFYEKHGTFEFITPVILGTTPNSPTYKIIDGQHRYFCIKKICEHFTQKNIPRDHKIFVIIIPCQQDQDIVRVFNHINTNQPLPEFIALNVLAIIELKMYIRENYKEYLSDSIKPKAPNIHIDTFCEYIFKNYYENDVIANSCSYGIQNIIQWLENENIKHRDFLFDNKEHYQSFLQKCETKRKKFYLGIHWVKQQKSTRKSISKSMREQCWKKFTNQFESKCPCCEIAVISFTNFECGHIISHKNGGKTSLDNLIPLCVQCNRTMSHKNYHDYKQSIHC